MWYLKFESFVLCKKGTQEPMPFASQEDCQQYIDNNCDPREFPVVEFVQCDDPNEIVKWIQTKKQN